jgi:outer membrane protein assembly factor BamB
MLRLPLPSFLTLALALSPSRADWPQWRGPNRDGHAADAKLPAKWPADAPKPKWTATVGEGYSGPAVVGGKVFIMGREKGSERCLCFNADTGARLWKHEYPESFKAPDPTAGTGPNATPTVDRDRVYFYGLGGQFHCLDSSTGDVIWKHDCMKEYWGVQTTVEGDDAWFPPCGTAASPLVDEDLVILPVGGKKAGAVSAFDRKSGELKWKSLGERSSYASPVIASPGGVRQVIAFTGLRMVGLRATDREVLWDHPFKARYEQTIVSPVVWKDLVVIAGEKTPTTAVKLAKSGDKVTKSVAWRNDDLNAYMTTPVVFADHLLGYDQRSNSLACIDLATGRTAWTQGISGKYHSLVVAGGVVLVLNSEGELLVLKATPKEFAQLAKWRVSGRGSWAHLAVVGNRLYVKDKTELHCIEL